MSFSHKFAVSGIWVYPPDNYPGEQPIPTVGYTLNRRAVNHGYPILVFSWSLLDQEEMSGIWGAWQDALDNNDTRVEVTYLDKAAGTLVTKWGTIHEPIVGSQHTVFYEQVALKVVLVSDTK